MIKQFSLQMPSDSPRFAQTAYQLSPASSYFLWVQMHWEPRFLTLLLLTNKTSGQGYSTTRWH